MAGSTSKPRGNLALAFVGYFGVIASVVSGTSRWFVIGFATLGFLGYVLTTSNLHNYVVHSIFVRRFKSRWNLTTGSSVSIAGGVVCTRIAYGASALSSTVAIPDNVQALLNSKGFRCEIRKPWRFKRIECNQPVALRGTAFIESDLPAELIQVLSPASLVLLGGPYVVKWRNDEQWKAIAKGYVGFDERGFQIRFGHRVYYRWLKWKMRLANTDQWPKIDDPTT